MVDKILDQMEFYFEELSFIKFCANVKVHLMKCSVETQKKFIFSLYDADNNGVICPKDLTQFVCHFGGILPSVISCDVRELISRITSKREEEFRKTHKTLRNFQKDQVQLFKNQYEDKKPNQEVLDNFNASHSPDNIMKWIKQPIQQLEEIAENAGYRRKRGRNHVRASSQEEEKSHNPNEWFRSQTLKKVKIQYPVMQSQPDSILSSRLFSDTKLRSDKSYTRNRIEFNQSTSGYDNLAQGSRTSRGLFSPQADTNQSNQTSTNFMSSRNVSKQTPTQPLPPLLPKTDEQDHRLLTHREGFFTKNFKTPQFLNTSRKQNNLKKQSTVDDDLQNKLTNRSTAAHSLKQITCSRPSERIFKDPFITSKPLSIDDDDFGLLEDPKIPKLQISNDDLTKSSNNDHQTSFMTDKIQPTDRHNLTSMSQFADSKLTKPSIRQVERDDQWVKVVLKDKKQNLQKMEIPKPPGYRSPSQQQQLVAPAPSTHQQIETLRTYLLNEHERTFNSHNQLRLEYLMRYQPKSPPQFEHLPDNQMVDQKPGSKLNPIYTAKLSRDLPVDCLQSIVKKSQQLENIYSEFAEKHGPSDVYYSQARRPTSSDSQISNEEENPIICLI